jgi:hypothetical protein
MNFETDQVVISVSREELFNFLCDLNNFKELMPSSVSHWQSTSETCSFKLGGMANLGLTYAGKSDISRLDMKSFGEVMFPYTLSIFLESCGAQESKAKLTFQGDVNPFMRMMVEGPTKDFFNYLIHKVQKKYNPAVV